MTGIQLLGWILSAFGLFLGFALIVVLWMRFWLWRKK